MGKAGPVKREFHFENEDGIMIRVIRKSIKNIYIRIYPPEGEVIVTAPVTASLSRIRQFTKNKRNWIIKNHYKLRLPAQERNKKYLSGEMHYFEGKALRMIIDYSKNEKGVFLSNDMILLRVEPEASEEQRKKVLEAWYRQKLLGKIPSIIRNWEERLEVEVSEARIRKMKTRWGSCNTVKRRIWLSLELAKYSDAILEYIIVHEMAHLLERKHNKRFYSILDRNMPDWKERKNRLKSLKY